jgi:glycosyltransferase involved in cell wall biosynthesis
MQGDYSHSLRPVGPGQVKVAVLTTSYPRYTGDAAGHFIGEAVARLRAQGVEVAVASPASFGHFGIAYGDGVVGNLRRHPLRAARLPLFIASFRRAAGRAAADADLIHAHWLPAGAIAGTLRKPYVVQVWGTDLELARRAPRLFRPVLRRARAVVAASSWLADEARAIGAPEVEVIPSGVDVPDEVGPSEEPPQILYAGRLSPEKGIRELLEAAHGLNLTVVGDGPLSDLVPGARGFVPHEELLGLYRRAAVVACPSHREGFGVVCAEAMAHGRPVVASAVGGLLDLVVDGETGLLVPPGDVPALRAALERLLGDAGLRRRMGEAARERIRQRFSWDVVTGALVQLYERAATPTRADGTADSR